MKSIIISSGIISWLVGELLMGGFVKHMFHDSYLIYQLFFFGMAIFLLELLNIFEKKFTVRLVMVFVCFYFSGYITYHIIHLIVYGLDFWLGMFKKHLILFVFTPSCLSAILTAILFSATYEIQIIIQRKFLKQPP